MPAWDLININKSHDALSIIAADIMSLVVMKSPKDFGADIVVGSTQRFGVPMGLGGPHAASARGPSWRAATARRRSCR